MAIAPGGVPVRDIKGYSAFVKLVKYTLPVVALGVVGLILLWPHLKPDTLKFSLGFAALKVKEAEDPSMVNPRYLGTDDDAQPFSVTADLARALKGETGVFELDAPKADLAVKDGTWLVLTAERGLYARDSKELALEGAVNLYHDSGYEFLTEKAKIYLGKSIAEGDAPIRGQGPFGNVEAQGFRLVDNGRTIYFTGKSKVVIFSGAGQGTK